MGNHSHGSMFDDADEPAFKGSLPTQPSTTPMPNPFKVGQKVEANFGGKGRWYPGKVKFVHKDATVDVLYNDGDTEDDVPIANVRPLDGSDAATPKASAPPKREPKEPAAATGQLKVRYCCRIGWDWLVLCFGGGGHT